MGRRFEHYSIFQSASEWSSIDLEAIYHGGMEFSSFTDLLEITSENLPVNFAIGNTQLVVDYGAPYLITQPFWNISLKNTREKIAEKSISGFILFS